MCSPSDFYSTDKAQLFVARNLRALRLRSLEGRS